MLNQGLGGWPARRAIMSPGRTAFVFQHRPTTYAQLFDRTTRLAAQLRAAGIRHGDRVAYLGPNHPAFVETMFATHMLGAVFVPLNFRLTAPEIDYMLGHSGAGALIYAPQCGPVVRQSRHAATRPTVAALTDPADGELDYETWLAAGDPAPIDLAVGLDEVACILYTSGTTGRPKGATLTHGNLVWNCYNLLVGVDVAGDEVTLVSAPLFHVAALNQTLLPTFLKGGCSVIMPSWDVDECFYLIERYGVTWMFGVTAMFAALAQSPRWDSACLSSVRSLMTGGAPVPAALIRTYQDRGLVFCQGYGLTETSPGATFLEAAQSRHKIGSAGLPAFFTNVRCVRPDLTDTAPGEPGEVIIQGPNVTPGYWNDPEATANAFSKDRWFHSGDIASVDADGHFHIIDRVKDMYISGGENVYPAEVEAAIFEHPTVTEVAVIGVPDPTWGEVGRAFVTTAQGGHLDIDALRAFLSGRLAKYKIPVYLEVVTDLPRTGSNKIHKTRLRDLPLP